MRTRQGVPYIGLELDHYDECMRAVPAIAKARAEERCADVKLVIEGLHRSAQERLINPVKAWSILASASMNWVSTLFETLAGHQEVPVTETLDEAIARAAEWSCGE